MSHGTGSDRRRVFVVLLGDDSLMLFPTWEAAEQCADKRQLPLDHIHEFETDPDQADHLHLLFSGVDGRWRFHGKWPSREPAWKEQPDRIRLDHFHVQGPGFRLFRRKVFPWRPGLLTRIDPMAPEAVLNEFVQPMAAPKAPGPTSPSERPQIEKRPLRLKRDRPATDDSASSRQASGPEESAPTPEVPRPPARAEPERSPEPVTTPAQIPPPPPEASVLSPAVEEAAPAPESVPPESVPEPEPAPESQAVKVRRIWPMRLIVVTASMVVFWIIGLVYPFLPVRTTEEIIAPIAPLRQATKVAIEPGFIYFELPVDPIHQQRWVQTLELDPIPFGQSFGVPAYAVLINWEQPEVFIPPPFSEEAVAEWWNPRERRVAHGFYHQWEDGSLLILDLQRNALVGWGQARHFAAYMR